MIRVVPQNLESRSGLEPNDPSWGMNEKPPDVGAYRGFCFSVPGFHGLLQRQYRLRLMRHEVVELEPAVLAVAVGIERRQQR